MEDKQSIKKVLESQGEVHEKVANQSNSELPSSSPTQSSGPPRIQIDIQIAYDLSFGRSTYARKAKEITFPMTRSQVVHNYQNSTNLQNRFWCCTTVLARWVVYPVGVHSGRVLGFDHDPRPFIFSSHHHFMWVLLRLICQEQFHRHSFCTTPSFVS
jgi:hypothetical protein